MLQLVNDNCGHLRRLTCEEELQVAISHTYRVDNREDALIKHMKKQANDQVRQAKAQAKDPSPG